MIPNESSARRHGPPTVDRVRLASTTTRVPPAGRLLWGRGVLALMALAIFFWWSSLAGTPVAVAGMSGVARSATEPATERFVARTTVWLRGGFLGEASGLVEWTRQDEDGLRRYDLSASPNSARVAPGRRVEDFTAPTPWRLGLRDGRVEIATGPVEPFAGLLEQVSDQLGSPNRMSQKSNVYGSYEQVGLTPASLSAPLLRGGEDDRLDYAMVRKTLDESAIEEKIGADLAGSLGTLEVVRAVALPFRADIGFGKVLVGYQQLLLVRRAETGRMLMAVSSFGLSEPAGKETDPKSDEAALEEIYKGDVLRVQRVLLADGRDESDQRMLGAVPVAVEDFMAPIPLEPAGGSSSGSEVPDWAALGMFLASSMDVAGLSVAESGLNPLAATASPEVGMWTSALLRAGGGAAYVESLERLPEQPEVPSSVQPWSDAVLTQTAKASVAGASVGAIGGVAGLLASRATDSGLTLSIPSAPAPGAVAGAGASAGLQASVLLTAVVAEVATVAIVAAVATPAVVGAAAGGGAAATAGLTTTQIALIGGGAVAVGGIAAAAGGGGGDDGGGGGGASCESLLFANGGSAPCTAGFSRVAQGGSAALAVGNAFSGDVGVVFPLAANTICSPDVTNPDLLSCDSTQTPFAGSDPLAVDRACVDAFMVFSTSIQNASGATVSCRVIYGGQEVYETTVGPNQTIQNACSIPLGINSDSVTLEMQRVGGAVTGNQNVTFIVGALVGIP